MPALNLFDSVKLAEKYGVKFVKSAPAKTRQEITAACRKTGFPVALKLVSSKISHKTDAGGVILNVLSEKGALRGFDRLKKLSGFEGVLVQKMVSGTEIIIGGKRDEHFGPTILFGLGGIFVETFKDYSIRVCPINPHDAGEMICSLKGFALLKGARGQKGVNISLIKKELLNVSKLMMKEKKVVELDLNPLIATPKSVLAVDARIVT